MFNKQFIDMLSIQLQTRYKLLITVYYALIKDEKETTYRKVMFTNAYFAYKVDKI